MYDLRQNQGAWSDSSRVGAPIRLAVAAVLAGWLGFAPSPAATETLRELIPELVQTHNSIKAAEADLAAAGERSSAVLGGWYPSLNVRSHIGQEEINKPSGTKDTSMVTREADFSVTQLLWDFGKVNSAVRSSELRREAARYGLAVALQDLLLRAATAYINVMRYNEVLTYSLQSEDNIKKQSEIEDALVRRGAGLSTDVLNSKQQLAGAQARRVLANGYYTEARNAYRGVFQRDLMNIQSMRKPPLPLDLLPTTVEDTVFVALRENPELKKVATSAADFREQVQLAKVQGFTPTLNLVGERKFKHDVQGTVGRQQETVGKVELNFPFNLGLTAVNTLKAANETANAEEQRVVVQKDKTEQDARDAWSKFETMRMRLDYLRNQTDIAAEYLELARRERQAGTRTLNDILRAETDLINANSDAASAEADFMIAVFTVLKTMGRLTPEHVMAVR